MVQSEYAYSSALLWADLTNKVRSLSKDVLSLITQVSKQGGWEGGDFSILAILGFEEFLDLKEFCLPQDKDRLHYEEGLPKGGYSGTHTRNVLHTNTIRGSGAL